MVKLLDGKFVSILVSGYVFIKLYHFNNILHRWNLSSQLKTTLYEKLILNSPHVYKHFTYSN